MDALLSFPIGALAGLALAVPLGAIGVLLVQEGLSGGWWNGLSAAAAVATVDTVYCSIAVLAGAFAAPVVVGWAPWPQLAGGAVLVAIGARALVKSRTSLAPASTIPEPSAYSSPSRFALFLTLTAINPATLVYFVAILPGLHEIAPSIPAQIAFVAGVAVASFGWQSALVAGGSILRRRTGPKFRGWTAAIGNGAVIVLGIAVITQALSA